MNVQLSETDIERIWNRFIAKTCNDKDKELRPILNLLGSV